MPQAGYRRQFTPVTGGGDVNVFGRLRAIVLDSKVEDGANDGEVAQHGGPVHRTVQPQLQEPLLLPFPPLFLQFLLRPGVGRRRRPHAGDSAKKENQDGLEAVDWRKFYESVKEFLEDE